MPSVLPLPLLLPPAPAAAQHISRKKNMSRRAAARVAFSPGQSEEESKDERRKYVFGVLLDMFFSIRLFDRSLVFHLHCTDSFLAFDDDDR